MIRGSARFVDVDAAAPIAGLRATRPPLVGVVAPPLPLLLALLPLSARLGSAWAPAPSSPLAAAASRAAGAMLLVMVLATHARFMASIMGLGKEMEAAAAASLGSARGEGG